MASSRRSVVVFLVPWSVMAMAMAQVRPVVRDAVGKGGAVNCGRRKKMQNEYGRKKGKMHPLIEKGKTPYRN